METPKKFLIFFQKKAFLIYLETETPPPSPPKKKFLYFRKQNFLIFQETETPKKFLIFHKVTFRARKMKKPTLKKFLMKWNFPAPNFKKTSYIPEGASKA